MTFFLSSLRFSASTALVSGPARHAAWWCSQPVTDDANFHLSHRERELSRLIYCVLSSRNVTTAALNRSQVHLLHAHRHHRVSVGPILFLQPSFVHSTVLFLKRLSPFFCTFSSSKKYLFAHPDPDRPSIFFPTAAARRGIEICTFSRCNWDGWRAAFRRVDAWQCCRDENTIWMVKVYLLQLKN